MTEQNHCRDCCCARSWKALGVTEYTGRSIPEHIEDVVNALNGMIGLVQLLARNEDIPAEIRTRMTTGHRFKDAQRCFPTTKWDEYGLAPPDAPAYTGDVADSDDVPRGSGQETGAKHE